jgi:uroporphyrinogen-III decarboxylase
MHLPQFLSPKDFERVYWPSFIKLANYFTNKGYVIRYYFESNYEHLYDYLQELPKGQIVGLFEDDDLRKAKKFLGNNMAIAGGMPTSLLYLGSTQECIDYAKALIDDLAPGGGYIFAMNKIMLSPTDGRAENLKAVTEFAHEYGVYK